MSNTCDGRHDSMCANVRVTDTYRPTRIERDSCSVEHLYGHDAGGRVFKNPSRVLRNSDPMPSAGMIKPRGCFVFTRLKQSPSTDASDGMTLSAAGEFSDLRCLSCSCRNHMNAVVADFPLQSHKQPYMKLAVCSGSA